MTRLIGWFNAAAVASRLHRLPLQLVSVRPLAAFRHVSAAVSM
jgi:hypothetical protein